tara:strand:- start:121 stop:831 length:711 start_codon:yes stop_codon:yes gene_type:complete
MANRSFLMITYKLFGHLNKLSGVKKSHALNCYLSLMKYAWRKNNYECGLRYSTIAKDTNLSRITVRRTIDTLCKMNIISTRRGRSGKSYKINPLFLKTEQDGSILYTSNNQMYKKDHSNVKKRSVLEEHYNNINKDNKNSKITRIILSCNGSKEDSVKKLKTLPTPELLKAIELKDNPWYCQLALTEKEESEGKGKLVDPQIIANSLKKISKESNFAYKKKKEFNIKNGIKPWENK